MKILIALLALSVSFQVSAQAPKKMKKTGSYSRQYGMAGCGLGSVVMGKSGGQLFAATTNGTSSNQLFGITSGSLNCVDGKKAQVAQKSDFYIQQNKFSLQGDIAQGQGETLAAYTQIMGCENGSEVSGLLKENYDVIFNNENRNPNDITDAIMSVIISNEAVAARCQLG